MASDVGEFLVLLIWNDGVFQKIRTSVARPVSAIHLGLDRFSARYCNAETL
jgi:hypothetical protein